MIKKNKWTLLITSLVILLPALVGVLLWDKLPTMMATHWGADGTADGFGGKAFSVFGIPCIMLALQWLGALVTAADPKNKNHNGKMFRVVLWIMPVITIVLSAFMYAVALGAEFSISTVILLMLGLMFIIFGNYMPKCKRNSTMGIKLPWTLSNDVNWNKTHRLSGRLWVIGGIAILLCTLLPSMTFIYPLAAIMLAMIVVPTVYSYSIYRRQQKNGVVEDDKLPEDDRFQSIGNKIALVIVPLILIGAAAIMLIGDIDIQYGNRSFTIDATFWNDLVVDYDMIDSIEYREDCETGVRTYGFGSPRLMLGIFENEEFGDYTRYSYTGCKACVVLESDGKILVISGEDNDSTRAIYEELTARIAE